MKNEQAKRIVDELDYYLQNHTDDYGEREHEAMQMAVKALARISEEVPKDLKKRVFYEIVATKNEVAKELGCKTNWSTVSWLFMIETLEDLGFCYL